MAWCDKHCLEVGKLLQRLWERLKLVGRDIEVLELPVDEIWKLGDVVVRHVQHLQLAQAQHLDRKRGDAVVAEVTVWQ